MHACIAAGRSVSVVSVGCRGEGKVLVLVISTKHSLNTERREQGKAAEPLWRSSSPQHKMCSDFYRMLYILLSYSITLLICSVLEYGAQGKNAFACA